MTDPSQTVFLVDQLERAHAGDPWHGSSRATLLADVTAKEAARRPAPSVHSIWELVLHMTAWTREVTRRVQGGKASDPEMGDWPALPTAPDERAWRAALAAADEAHVALREAVRALDPPRLTTRVGDERNAALGTGVTFAQTINGLVQHDAYHSGQIAVVKKLLRNAPHVALILLCTLGIATSCRAPAPPSQPVVLAMTWPRVPWSLLQYGAPAAMVVAPIVLYPFSRLIWLAFDLMLRPVVPSDIASPPNAR